MTLADHLGRGPGAVLDPSANPFVLGPGRPPPVVVGRDAQHRLVGDALRQLAARRPADGLFVVGPRGLGKTTLLAEAAAAAPTVDVDALHLECGADHDATAAAFVTAMRRDLPSRAASLGRRLTRLRVGPVEIGLARLPEDEPLRLVDAIVATAREHHEAGGALLLTVDEAQLDPQATAAFVTAMQACARDGVAVGTIAAGLPPTLRVVADVTSYAERWTRTDLAPLDEDASLRGVAEPLAAAGVTLAAERRSHVHTLTGGYPYFVQILGSALWSSCDDPARITPAAWKAAARDAGARIEGWLEQRWQRVNPAQRRYLEACAALGVRARTGEVAESLGETHQALAPYRARLLDDGLLYVPERGAVAFVVEPLAGWIRRRHVDAG